MFSIFSRRCAWGFPVALAAFAFPANAQTPTVSIGDTTFPEGNSGYAFATLSVSLNKPSRTPVKICYYTKPNSATQSPSSRKYVDPVLGADYREAGGILEFAPGEVSKPVRVAIYGDTIPENYDDFEMWIRPLTSNVVLQKNRGRVSIEEDDFETVSPFGKMAIFSPGIISGSNHQTLIFNVGTDAKTPVLSPDASKAAYSIASRAINGKQGFFIDGTTPDFHRTRVFRSGVPPFQLLPSGEIAGWNAAGNALLFTTYTTLLPQSSELWIVNASDLSARQITNTLARSEVGYRWQSDGTILFLETSSTSLTLNPDFLWGGTLKSIQSDGSGEKTVATLGNDEKLLDVTEDRRWVLTTTTFGGLLLRENGGTPRQILSKQYGINGRAFFYRGGNRILCSAVQKAFDNGPFPGGAPLSFIFNMNPDGTDLRITKLGRDSNQPVVLEALQSNGNLFAYRLGTQLRSRSIWIQGEWFPTTPTDELVADPAPQRVGNWISVSDPTPTPTPQFRFAPSGGAA